MRFLTLPSSPPCGPALPRHHSSVWPFVFFVAGSVLLPFASRGYADPIHTAAANGNLAEVKALLDKDPELVNRPEVSGWAKILNKRPPHCITQRKAHSMGW
jgi:hypothetical protein